MNPLFNRHPLPPRRPANPVLAPQEPDKAGLAAMLAQTRSKVWPVEDMGRVVDERRPQGYPMPPMVEMRPGEPEPLPGFTGPGFVGPVPGPERHVLPQVMRPSSIRGMADMNKPVAEDEYRMLLNKLRAGAVKL